MSQSGTFLTGAPMGGSVNTLTGNSGGAVGPDGAGNINVIGMAPIDVAGNPGTFTLTIDVSDATTIATGVVELATDAETIDGTDTTRAIVPSSLKAKLGAQTQYAVPIGDGDNMAFQWSAAATDGQVLIGATGAAPVFANITSTGGTVVISNGANSINLETNPPGLFAWTEVVVAGPTGMTVNNGYIANNAVSVVVLTLPAVAAQGSIIRVAGKGAGLWQIAQNAGQSISIVNVTTTIGVGGSLTAVEQFDTVELLCVTANTEWVALSGNGNLTVA